MYPASSGFSRPDATLRNANVTLTSCKCNINITLEQSFNARFLNFHFRYFETFVILTILINCVFLVLENPPDEAE